MLNFSHFDCPTLIILSESDAPLDVEREHGGGVLDLLDALVVRHLEDLLPVDLPDVKIKN